MLVLTQGKLAFFPQALNKHRRHERSVTLGSFNAAITGEHFASDTGPPPNGLVARLNAQELYVQFGLATGNWDVRRNPS